MLTFASIAFLLPSQALAIDLSFMGSCPGAMDIQITDITPGGTFALVTANSTGSTPVPAGPCAGTSLGLGAAGLTLRLMTGDDGDGRHMMATDIPAPACGLWAQTVDFETCTVSEPWAIGAGGGDAGDTIYVADGRGGPFGGVTEFGFHAINTATGMVTGIARGMDYGVTGMDFAPDGTLLAVQAIGRDYPFFMAIDPSSGEQLVLSESTDLGALSGFATVADQVAVWTEAGDDFGFADLDSGTVMTYASDAGTLNNCYATAPSGELYMLSSSSLYQISTELPGETILIGTVSGFTAVSGQGCTFHNGNLYVAAGIPKELWEINMDLMEARSTGILLSDNTDAIASPTR